MYLVELNCVPRLAKSKFGIYYLASFHQDSEFSRFLWDQAGSNRGWGGGKAFPTPENFLEGKSKKKTFFSLWKVVFSKFASWKGLPLQMRFGQLEKHLKSSLPAITGVWRGKSKNNFSGSEKLFFEICQLEGSPIAIALWAAGKAPEKLTACYHGCLDGKIKKNNFSGFEKLFFEICQLEGSPISIALWNVCPVYIVGTGICCCHCVAASFHTDLTKSPRSKFKNISRTSAELALNLADSYDMLLLGNYCWIRRQHGQDLEDVHQTLVKETESTEFDFNDKLLMHSILNHLGCLKPGRQSGYSHQP